MHDQLQTKKKSLRDQIGQDNLVQSSVLATRRLDEALLRLDQAVGRTRKSVESYREMPAGEEVTSSVPRPKGQAPRGQRTNRRNQAVDLELDESVADSSVMWFEPTQESEGNSSKISGPIRYRLEPAKEPNTSAQHFRVTQSEQLTSTESPTCSADTPARPGFSGTQQAASFESLYADPIDVMMESETAEVILEDSSNGSTGVFSPSQSVAERLDRAKAQLVRAKSQEARSPRVIKSKPEPSVDKPRVATVSPPAQQSSKTFVDETATRSEEKPAQSEPVTSSQTEAKSQKETSSQTEVNEPAVALQPFAATWQVDEFVVPNAVDELFLAGSLAEQLASRLAAAKDKGLQTIAITSSKSGEGRSTVAMGIALSVAFSGLKVALVDADTAGVRLVSDLNLDLDHSWLDSVRTDLPLEEAAVHSNADSLTLIPLLDREDEPAMEPTDLRRLLRKLQSSFDLVIVDCGPSEVSSVTLCDTALIVRDMQRTKALEVETLAIALRRGGLHGVGVIENFCQPRSA